MSATTRRAFAADASPMPEPPGEIEIEGAPEAVGLAEALLTKIAEDPGLRPSYRMAARRYFRELRKAAANAAGDAAKPG